MVFGALAEIDVVLRKKNYSKTKICSQLYRRKVHISPSGKKPACLFYTILNLP
jgi:hypothetical protein